MNGQEEGSERGIEHGADIYHENDKVLPTCRCGWEGTWLPTFDEAADAYALHRIGEEGDHAE